MPSDEQPFADIEQALKRAAAALREAEIPFLLGGSLASWARGGPETRHDLDLIVKPADAEKALEDVMVTKLRALTEHSLRYESLLQIARALREQIDWPAVRARTHESPFARAFFVLLDGLDIVPEAGAGGEPRPRAEPRVRVVTPQGSTATQGG